MIRCLYIFAITCAALPADAQNLVVNPGFEELEKNAGDVAPCRHMQYGKQFTEAVRGWSSFKDRTPDLIRYDSTLTDCPYPAPKGGNRYAGIITFLPRKDTGYEFDYHEYIQGALTQPLVPGRRYRVSFWVHQSDSVAKAHLRSVYGDKVVVYPLATNNLGVCLLRDPISPNMGFQQQEPWLELQPVFESQEVIRTGHGMWRLLSGSFTATDAARYFLIGNFREDVHTSIESKQDLSHLSDLNAPGKKNFFQRTVRIAYYCIDNVSIMEDDFGAAMESALEAEGRYVFQGVLFATGSHELAPESFKELSALAAYLLNHPEKRAEIAGHTDNVGSDEANRLLSQRRAQSVFRYLAEQGVAENRLSFKGYGKSRPIATNDTEEGRQQNRRVECVLK